MDKMNSNVLGSFSYTGTGSTTLGLVGLMTGSGHEGSQSYQYEWKYYYSPYGIDKALKYNGGQLLITIDATTAPNGRMVSLYYQDHTCQTNCFSGEAFAAYDPCGNMISLIDKATATEVWSRAIDKNSGSTIGIYNPHDLKIPLVGDGTISLPYDEPIDSSIAITIGEGGGVNIKDLLASNTDLTIAIGEYGANVTIYGDDDCEDSICGGAKTDYDMFCECMETCYENKSDGTWGHWEDDLRNITLWSIDTYVIDSFWVNVFWDALGVIGLALASHGLSLIMDAAVALTISITVGVLKVSVENWLNSENPTPEEYNKARSDAIKERRELEEANPWLKDQTLSSARARAIRNCLSSCSHHIDRDIAQIELSTGRMCP
jgi:hypothetical protein